MNRGRVSYLREGEILLIRGTRRGGNSSSRRVLSRSSRSNKEESLGKRFCRRASQVGSSGRTISH